MRLRDVKKGDRFTEEDGGYVVTYVALESAREVDDDERGKRGHECRVLVVEGTAALADPDDGALTLFECHEPGGYGLNLYPA